MPSRCGSCPRFSSRRRPPSNIRWQSARPRARGWPVAWSSRTRNRPKRGLGVGEEVILARATTSPDDLHGIIAARGLMTEQGGSTSHAAVVSRELGRPCVVGCGSNTVTALAGQRVTLDGATGRVWAGNLAVEQSRRSLKRRSGQAGRVGRAADPNAAVEGRTKRLRTPSISTRSAKIGAPRSGRASRFAVACSKPMRASRRRWRRTCARPWSVIGCRPCSPACNSRRAKEARGCGNRPRPSRRLPASRNWRCCGWWASKGRASVDILADSLSLSSDVVVASYTPLCEGRLCTKTGGILRLTPAGRDRVALLLADERAHADPAAVIALYEDFCVFNAELKQIMTDLATQARWHAQRPPRRRLRRRRAATPGGPARPGRPAAAAVGAAIAAASCLCRSPRRGPPRALPPVTTATSRGSSPTATTRCGSSCTKISCRWPD